MSTTAPPPRRSDAPTCPHGSGPKRCFPSKRDAELAAWRILASSGTPLRSYKCGACRAWHLTSWRQR